MRFVVFVLTAIVACAGASSRPPETLGTENANATLFSVAKQCALVASCADVHDSSAFRTPEACIDWYSVNAHDEAPLAECVMKAKSCGDISGCTHAHAADRSAEMFCKAHPGVLSTCEGNALFTCEGEGSTESTSVDCTKLFGTCGEHKGGGLVTRGCVSPSMCPQGVPDHRCAGNSVVDCQDGIADKTECPTGSRCVTGADPYGAPTARCKSESGRECSIAGGAFCEGDVAYVCVQNGHYAGLHTANCGALGLGCAVRAGRVSCVHRGANACAQEPATCVGGDLRFCAGGEPFRVSCKELGFTGCDPSGGGGEALCTTRSP